MRPGTRTTAVVIALAISALAGRPAGAQTLTLKIGSQEAQRGAVTCPPTECTSAYGDTSDLILVPADRHVCLGTSLADTYPAYRCAVYVGASLYGRAVAPKVPVTVTFEITSDDGSPWGDDVRRTIRAQAPLMQSPGSGAPAPCSVVPAAEPRVSCARVGPRTFKVSGTTSSKTGLFVIPLQIVFPSSAGTQPVCEYIRLRGTAKSKGQTARADLGRRRFCA